MPTTISKLRSAWQTHAPFVWAVLKQLAIPTAIAVAYGVYDWHSSNVNFSLSAFLKVTLPALFFIMWFVGLYERARKRTTDKTSFENLSTGLESLTDLVKGLQQTPHATPANTTAGAFKSLISGSLIAEAFTIFSAGHRLAALLQAGVAFEQAVRAFARRQGLENADQLPLLRILQKLDDFLPQDWRKELHVLRQIRNQLAHASEEELSRIEQPKVVLNTYALAIKALAEGSHDDGLLLQ